MIDVMIDEELDPNSEYYYYNLKDQYENPMKKLKCSIPKPTTTNTQHTTTTTKPTIKTTKATIKTIKATIRTTKPTIKTAKPTTKGLQLQPELKCELI